MQIESINAVQAGYKISEALPPNKQGAPATHKGDEATEPASSSPSDAEQGVRSLNEAIKAFDVSIKFSRDEETGKVVIEVIDQKSGQTLQQIPNEATLHLSAALGKLQGLVFNQKA